MTEAGKSKPTTMISATSRSLRDQEKIVLLHRCGGGLKAAGFFETIIIQHLLRRDRVEGASVAFYHNALAALVLSTLLMGWNARYIIFIWGLLCFFAGPAVALVISLTFHERAAGNLQGFFNSPNLFDLSLFYLIIQFDISKLADPTDVPGLFRCPVFS